MVMLQRLEGRQYDDVAVATRKEQSTVANRRPTRVFADATDGGNPQAPVRPGSIPVERGLPALCMATLPAE